MKLAIMQPYLFPYAGYYSLVASVDKFVFYDDVDFIKGGWINRNRLILSGDVRYFTVPLSGASSNQKINQVGFQSRSQWERKLMASINQSYAKAPYLAQCLELIVDVFDTDATDIATLAKRSVEKVSCYLGLSTEFVQTSARYDNSHLRGADRVVDICIKEKAGVYMNLPGGRALYDSAHFQSSDIVLEFLESPLRAYPQFGEDFVAGLSVLDMLMFNDAVSCRHLIAGART
jgi:hypothetical protein